ncbi:cation diffusion facilitator family transporter [Kitasatospora sp. NPDC048365]|uniref:cation diffusion facilitator family transporter n=1 Tax=Kitasatospora sp. NPDC048365 TaxID=3364050 RepID=UPI003717C12F
MHEHGEPTRGSAESLTGPAEQPYSAGRPTTMDRDPRPAAHAAGRRTPADRATRLTVLVALVADLVIAVAKAVAGVLAPSPALLAESAHSVADSINQLFLLASLSRSRRRADAHHPFGYGKERFFWSLLAAVGIFVTGGCFSFYQGVHTWLSPPTRPESFLPVYVVLLVALIADGGSLVRVVVQLRGEARGGGSRPFWRSSDPTARTVLAEDSTAVLGVLVAAAGVAAHQLTGSSVWEGAAAVAIGLLLIGIAVRLGHEAQSLLVGQAVDPRLQRDAHRLLAGQREIDTVTALLTMRLGTDSALLAARVDLREGLDSEEVEEVCVRIKRQIREACPVFDQVFLDIIDAGSEGRARARALERELDSAAAEHDDVTDRSGP